LCAGGPFAVAQHVIVAARFRLRDHDQYSSDCCNTLRSFKPILIPIRHTDLEHRHCTPEHLHHTRTVAILLYLRSRSEALLASAATYEYLDRPQRSSRTTSRTISPCTEVIRGYAYHFGTDLRTGLAASFSLRFGQRCITEPIAFGANTVPARRRAEGD